MSRSFYAALALLSLIWGGSFYFIKVLLDAFGPWTIAFLRSSFGLVTITVIMLALRKPFGLKRIPWPRMAIMAVVNTAIPWGLIAFSETKVSSGMASVLNATTPIWTLIVGMLFFKTVSGRLQWVGMGIAFVGLIVLLDVNPASVISVDAVGFFGMMGATICYAVGSNLSRRLFQTGLSMYQITFGTLVSAAAGSGVLSLLTESPDWHAVTAPHNLGTLVGLGVMGSGIAYILFYFMVQNAGPEYASMVTYIVPATALVWGYTLLDEEIHWTLLAGMAIILAGVFLASYRPKPRKRLAPQN